MEWALVVVVVAALIVAFALAGRQRSSEGTNARAIARLEQKVDLLLQQAGLQLPEDPRMAEITALARSGRKIDAVKAYRQVTGADLAEAKRAVDQLA